MYLHFEKRAARESPVSFLYITNTTRLKRVVFVMFVFSFVPLISSRALLKKGLARLVFPNVKCHLWYVTTTLKHTSVCSGDPMRLYLIGFSPSYAFLSFKKVQESTP